MLKAIFSRLIRVRFLEYARALGTVTCFSRVTDPRRRQVSVMRLIPPLSRTEHAGMISALARDLVASLSDQDDGAFAKRLLVDKSIDFVPLDPAERWIVALAPG